MCAEKAATRLYTVIRGQGYDVTEFMTRHPGGAHMLEQAVGRDATHLFEMSHIRDEKSASVLSTLPKVDLAKTGITVDEGPFPNDSKFYKTIRERVRKEVLGGMDKQARGNMVGTILATIVISVVSYYIYLNCGCVLGAVWMGLVGAHIGMTINHSGNHGGATSSPFLNRLLGYADDLIGGSSLVWAYHHHVSHHAYCNDPEKDQDVFTGLPLLRFDDRLPKFWYNAYQHVYFHFLVPFLFVSVQMADSSALLTGKVPGCEMTGASAAEYRNAWIGKALHVLLGLILPVYYHGLKQGVLMFIVFSAVGSYTLAWLFSLSHNLEEAKDPKDDEHEDWAIMQVAHSANYGGAISSFLTGGLNLQIEHHLFPCMAPVHYQNIVPIVQEECKNFGVKYIAYDNPIPMAADLIKFLKKCGNAPYKPQ